MNRVLMALDANIFIYALEGNVVFGQPALRLLKLAESGSVAVSTSELCYVEILAGSSSLTEATHKLEMLFSQVGANPRPLDKKVLIKAAALRRVGLRTQDAIHVASAIENDATHFVTNDASLRKKSIPGIEIVSIARACKLAEINAT